MTVQLRSQSTTAEVMAASRDTSDAARLRGLETTLRRRDAVLAAVCDAASRFLSTADWDRDARHMLGMLGAAAEVSRAYLFEGYRDEQGGLRRRLRHAWAAPDVHPRECEPAMVDAPVAALGLGRWKRPERGDVLHGPIASLPPIERPFFARLGVRSFAAVPVFADDRWWGYLGFTDDVEVRDWTRSVLEALQAAAATLGAAIHRRNAAERVRVSEERFRRLTEAAVEGVLIHANGVMLEGNPALGRIFGYDLEELMGTNVIDLVATEESRERIFQNIRSGSEESYEITARRKDGTLITAEITARPTTHQGRAARVATVHDVTARKRAESELRRREAQLAEAQAIAHVGSFVWELSTNVLRGSDELYRIYGFEPDPGVTPQSILARVHPDDAQLVQRTIDEAIANAATYGVEHRIVRPSGEVRYFRVEGRVVVDDAGRPAQLIGAGQDVTERREAEAVARQLIAEQAARAAAELQQQRAAFLAEASRVLGSSFDYQTTLASLAKLSVPTVADFCTVDILARDGMAERVGVAHVDPGKEAMLWRLMEWARASGSMVPHLRRALLDGQPTLIAAIDDAYITANTPTAEHRTELLTISPRSLVCVPMRSSGKTLGALALFMSDSGRRYDEDDLALAEELAHRAALAVENARLFTEAEQATRARDQMLGVVAHDLRNPLGTILMATQLLSDTLPDESPARRQVTMVHRAGERMNHLIQDLLDVKRIEGGRLTVEPRPVAVEALLCEAVEALRPLAAASGLELVLDAPEDPATVSADVHRVHQVLSNLVGNAIKFTPRGGRITLTGVHTAREVRVAVADTGPGIPAEQLPHIFGHYWQGSRTDRRGIGLGLAIAKGIVEAHHGRIWVESTPGQGSRFYFTLPRVM